MTYEKGDIVDYTKKFRQSTGMIWRMEGVVVGTSASHGITHGWPVVVWSNDPAQVAAPVAPANLYSRKRKAVHIPAFTLADGVPLEGEPMAPRWEINLGDDGTLDTVFYCACLTCGLVWTERFDSETRSEDDTEDAAAIEQMIEDIKQEMYAGSGVCHCEETEP